MPGGRNQRASVAMDGFTLLELLVTLTIIGLLSGAAVLAIPDRGPAQRLQATARAVLDELRLAARESRALGQPVRIAVQPHHIHFEVYDGDGWSDLSLGRAREDGRLSTTGTRLSLHGQTGSRPRNAPVLMLPDGSRTPFSLDLRLHQEDLRIESDETGPLRLVMAGAQ